MRVIVGKKEYHVYRIIIRTMPVHACLRKHDLILLSQLLGSV